MNNTHSAISLHDKPSSDFLQKVQASQQLLQQVSTQFQTIKQASSLGAEDLVVSHLIDQLDLNIPMFVLDTGALHEQTYALIERLQASSKQLIEFYKPIHQSVIQFVRDKGQRSIFKSMDHRKQCCDIRKMEPLQRALKDQQAWITGLRREQSTNRAQVSQIQVDIQNRREMSKVNPLVDWTWGDVWHYIGIYQIDYNPLHDQFYPSIGCAPCTRAISLGEDFRAGRWWWEEATAKECGLHLNTSSLPFVAKKELA